MNNLIGTNDVKNELGKNFIEYAVACNTDRAIPDAKSGLKPVAKRILWSAYEAGRTFSKPHVKCARIVGDTMGAYHPHGDSSIYGTLVRLSQNWVLRYPLIDFHGSNGNIAGDGPAAARYTEARLSKLAEDGMLFGLKKRNVDFTKNYDETLEEPITLPAIFPNLLCNPNTGIGVAMACNWLPHNLGEVAQAIYDYMDEKEPMIPAPDFPTGGLIINGNDLPEIIKAGHGSVKIRGKYNIDKNKIIFYEIPYNTGTESLIAEVGKVCDDGEIDGIADIHDESNKKGLRIVIECKRDASIETVVKQIFAKTNFQTSISYNQVALVNKTPTELRLKDCIKIYLEHNIDCLIKEWSFDLKKAEDRLHIVEGLLIALEDIDNVITLIKKSTNSSVAKDALMEKYKLDEVQAKSILAMRLSSLAHMEKIELENEQKELFDFIGDLKYALATPERQKNEVKVRLQNIVKKYGDARRTEITNIVVPKEEKEIEEVVPEDCVVILSQGGDIKRVASNSFKVQKRNGKGVKTENDAIFDTIATNTVDTLMVFTDKGRMFRLLVDTVPLGTNISKGVQINSLINMEPGEKVAAITSLYRKTNAEYVLFITKQGLMKKTEISEYMKVKRSTGIAAINIKDGDAIANVTFVKDERIVLVTKQGISIHVETKDINPIGRVTAGVKGIKLANNDEVIIGMPIHNEKDCVAIFTSKGYGKKTTLDEFPLQNRSGKGVVVYKPTDITGEIVGAAMVSDEDNILLIGRPNSICIPAKEVPSLGRPSIGNIMMKNSTVNNIVKL